ncbi:MAG: hypothetical protein CL827_01075 [Crocinitomicaceae bacterium]|nr:hypothetical protein [Crocinitomicaceae bacterium]|tara:strand:+ start:4797 stop:5555 length:759 start_codon:yes stop_codon:yes gene_type:complete
MIYIYNEIENDPGLDKLKFLIEKALKGNSALIIKRGFKHLSFTNFENLMQNKLGFFHDKRHYTLNSELTISNWWSVRYNPEKDTSYTYSKTTQPLHIDNAWFSDPAELNLFCLEKQAVRGGENTFYPLDRLEEDLANEEPGLLNDLQKTEVLIQKGDGKYFNKTTILKNDKIFWNFYRTEKSDSKVKVMCEEFFKFLNKKEKTSSVDVFRCETGDAFCFHDQKILHGRLKFEASKKDDRILHQSMWKIKYNA